MKQLAYTTVLLTILSISGYSNDFFTEADDFFKKHVSEGRVAYTNIKENSKQLDYLIGLIASFDLSTSNDQKKIAFLINTYNILAIKGIVDSYPVKSPMNINNFFDSEVYNVGGKTVSLNQLEKEILYPLAKDPRLHFVLVCAAISCPKLANLAYTPDKLNEQIDNITKATLNDPDFIQVEGKKFRISEIFNWYSADFNKDGRKSIEFINDYRESKLELKGAIRYYSYNWDLNDQN